MADISLVAADIRPLPGAVIESYDAGGALGIGDLCYMATDGDVEEADASAAGTAYAIGIVVSISNAATGALTAAAGDRVDVCTFGRVTGFSGMTPGDVLYVSDTAGVMADAAGTTSHKFARARSAVTVFVNPAITEA